MKRHLFAFVLSSFAATTLYAKPDSSELIRRTFKAYIRSLNQRDGTAAASLVDRNTLSYYGRMLRLALHGGERVVRALPIMDRIIVLRTRHQVPLATLQRMDGSGLFAHGVKMDWMDRAKSSTFSPGIIEVRGRRATVYVLQQGKPIPLTFLFSREAPSTWHIDLTSLFAIGNAAFKSWIPKRQSEDEFILDLIGTISGRTPGKTIWRPLIP